MPRTMRACATQARDRSNIEARLRMQLQIGLGNSLLHTLGPSEQAQIILTEALAIADALGDLDAQLGSC